MDPQTLSKHPSKFLKKIKKDGCRISAVPRDETNEADTKVPWEIADPSQLKEFVIKSPETFFDHLTHQRNERDVALDYTEQFESEQAKLLAAYEDLPATQHVLQTA